MNEKPTHTPGPWMRHDYRVFREGQQASDLTFVAQTAFNAAQRTSTAEANARLIAAAPDLLTACKMALNERMFKDWPEVATALIAAIAKAEGTDTP